MLASVASSVLALLDGIFAAYIPTIVAFISAYTLWSEFTGNEQKIMR